MSIDEELLRKAFVSFGIIKDVYIPRDKTAEGGHRGFGFVEFENSNDAKSAIENMHMNKIFGQIIRCNMARPTRISTAGVHTAPIWELESIALADEDPILTNPKSTEEVEQ